MQLLPLVGLLGRWSRAPDDMESRILDESSLRDCSGEPAADPPEAVPGQGQGQGEVDPGLGPLEGPVAAGGLVGDGDPDAVAVQAVHGLQQRLVRLDDALE